MTTPLHPSPLFRVLDGSDLRPHLGAAASRRPSAPHGCRFCGLTSQDHGVHLIHRFVRADPPPRQPGAAQLDPPLLAA